MTFLESLLLSFQHHQKYIVTMMVFPKKKRKESKELSWLPKGNKTIEPLYKEFHPKNEGTRKNIQYSFHTVN